jgi:putative ABC transport system permease protein
MIKHIIKLIWSRKRKNFLLLLEIAISFLVLFAIGSMVIHNFQKYKLDLGYDYHDVWVIRFHWGDEDIETRRSKMIQVKQHLRSKTEIQNISATSGNHPYSFNTMTSMVNSVQSHYIICEDEFFDVLKIPLIDGEGFSEKDISRANRPIIINKKLAEELFPDENPTGKVVESDEIIIGVVDKYRYASSFMADKNVFFSRRDIEDTSYRSIPNNIIFRVVPGTGRKFEANLMREVSQMTLGWENELMWLEEEKTRKDKTVWIPIMILVVVSVFLIINVALGLFGLLWYNISRRKAEIGLRRAMGANISNISRYFVLEIMVLTTFALILGLFFAVQFPILGLFNLDPYVYVVAMVLSAAFIYLINWLCSVLPSRMASKIQIAEALHDEG